MTFFSKLAVSKGDAILQGPPLIWEAVPAFSAKTAVKVTAKVQTRRHRSATNVTLTGT